MTLPVSGALSILDIVGEFGGSAPHALTEYYRGGGLVPDTATNSGIPTSGAISILDFYGASAAAEYDVSVNIGKENGIAPVDVGYSDNTIGSSWTNNGGITGTVNGVAVRKIAYGASGDFFFYLAGTQTLGEVQQIEVTNSTGTSTYDSGDPGYTNIHTGGNTLYSWTAKAGQGAWTISEANAGNVFYNVKFTL